MLYILLKGHILRIIPMYQYVYDIQKNDIKLVNDIYKLVRLG